MLGRPLRGCIVRPGRYIVRACPVRARRPCLLLRPRGSPQAPPGSVGSLRRNVRKHPRRATACGLWPSSVSRLVLPVCAPLPAPFPDPRPAILLLPQDVHRSRGALRPHRQRKAAAFAALLQARKLRPAPVFRSAPTLPDMGRAPAAPITSLEMSGTRSPPIFSRLCCGSSVLTPQLRHPALRTTPQGLSRARIDTTPRARRTRLRSSSAAPPARPSPATARPDRHRAGAVT